MPNKNEASPSTGPYIVRVNPKSFEGRTFYYEIWADNGLGDRIAAVEMKPGPGRGGEAKANADLLSAGPEAAELVDAILAQARDRLGSLRLHRCPGAEVAEEGGPSKEILMEDGKSKIENRKSTIVGQNNDCE